MTMDVEVLLWCVLAVLTLLFLLFKLQQGLLVEAESDRLQEGHKRGPVSPFFLQESSKSLLQSSRNSVTGSRGTGKKVQASGAARLQHLSPMRRASPQVATAGSSLSRSPERRMSKAKANPLPPRQAAKAVRRQSSDFLNIHFRNTLLHKSPAEDLYPRTSSTGPTAKSPFSAQT